jgi:hypothetical protein
MRQGHLLLTKRIVNANRTCVRQQGLGSALQRVAADGLDEADGALVGRDG